MVQETEDLPCLQRTTEQYICKGVRVTGISLLSMMAREHCLLHHFKTGRLHYIYSYGTRVRSSASLLWFEELQYELRVRDETDRHRCLLQSIGISHYHRGSSAVVSLEDTAGILICNRSQISSAAKLQVVCRFSTGGPLQLIICDRLQLIMPAVRACFIPGSRNTMKMKYTGSYSIKRQVQ